METTQFYGFIYYESRLYAIVPKCQHFAVWHERVAASRRQSGCLYPL